MTHDLKTWPEFFAPLLKGEKRSEQTELFGLVAEAKEVLKVNAHLSGGEAVRSK